MKKIKLKRKFIPTTGGLKPVKISQCTEDGRTLRVAIHAITQLSTQNNFMRAKLEMFDDIMTLLGETRPCRTGFDLEYESTIDGIKKMLE